MKRTWILIANASKACVLEREGRQPRLKQLSRFEDPLGRAKGVDLVSDRAGYESSPSRGVAGSPYSPPSDPRRQEHERFALRLARHLDEGVAAQQCDALVLLASNPFLGEVKAHLGRQSHKALVSTSSIDLTALSASDLEARVLELLDAA